MQSQKEAFSASLWYYVFSTSIRHWTRTQWRTVEEWVLQGGRIDLERNIRYQFNLSLDKFQRTTRQFLTNNIYLISNGNAFQITIIDCKDDIYNKCFLAMWIDTILIIIIYDRSLKTLGGIPFTKNSGAIPFSNSSQSNIHYIFIY